MLSPADAALAQRDSAVPGLAMLLDEDAFAAALQDALPERTIEVVRSRYVRYKPGTNCLVAYNVMTDTGEIALYAKARRPTRRLDQRAIRTGATAAACPRIDSSVLDAQSIAVYVMPNDRKLPALARLDQADGRTRLLRAAMPRRPQFHEASVHCLRYKPERRYVGQLVAGGGERAVVKLYTEAEYRAARRSAFAFTCTDTLRLAPPIGVCDDHQALFYDWLPGHSLGTTMWTSDFNTEVLLHVGVAMASLHAQSTDGLTAQEPDSQTSAMLAAAESIAVLCPNLGPRSRSLASRLAAELAQSFSMPRPIHGDFYADQVLLGHEGVTLLDLDNAGYGDPATDLGSFAAHAFRDALRGKGSLSQARRVVAVLMEGYLAHAPEMQPLELRPHVAAALLRLAPEAFRYREAEWSTRIHALLEYAEQEAGYADIYA